MFEAQSDEDKKRNKNPAMCKATSKEDHNYPFPPKTSSHWVSNTCSFDEAVRTFESQSEEDKKREKNPVDSKSTVKHQAEREAQQVRYEARQAENAPVAPKANTESVDSSRQNTNQAESSPEVMQDESSQAASEAPVTEAPNSILRSTELSNRDKLELLAQGKGALIKNGNKNDEVKSVQATLLKLEFDIGRADGDFGKKTEQSIKAFQQEFIPSHSTHPEYEIGSPNGIVGKNTLLALDEALADGWVHTITNDEMDKEWLQVPMGQLTFDAEGNDIEGNRFFTRVPHVPNNGGKVIDNSGITLGKGLDLGNRSAGEIEALFNQASKNCNPISDKFLEWLKSGAGKTKQSAYDHFLTLEESVPEEDSVITRKMQHYLFLAVYPDYINKARRLMTKQDVCDAYIDGNTIDWDALPEKVKDVLVDLGYVGMLTGSGDRRGNTRSLMVPAVYHDQVNQKSGVDSELYQVMKNDTLWRVQFGTDRNRYDARAFHLRS